jgi:hypothetical protein
VTAALAYHEAGHAVAAVLLGGRITGPLAMTESGRGLAFTGAPERDLDELDAGLPAVAWPAQLRRSLEIEAMICLAGAEAEKYAPLHLVDAVAGGYSLDERTIARRTPVLPPTGEELRKLSRALGETLPSDVENIYDLATVMSADDGGAWPLIEWWRRETTAFVAGPLFQARLHPLADALMRHGTLSAGSVRELLEPAQVRA